MCGPTWSRWWPTTATIRAAPPAARPPARARPCSAPPPGAGPSWSSTSSGCRHRRPGRSRSAHRAPVHSTVTGSAIWSRPSPGPVPGDRRRCSTGPVPRSVSRASAAFVLPLLLAATGLTLLPAPTQAAAAAAPAAAPHVVVAAAAPAPAAPAERSRPTRGTAPRSPSAPSAATSPSRRPTTPAAPSATWSPAPARAATRLRFQRASSAWSPVAERVRRVRRAGDFDRPRPRRGHPRGRARLPPRGHRDRGLRGRGPGLRPGALRADRSRRLSVHGDRLGRRPGRADVDQRRRGGCRSLTPSGSQVLVSTLRQHPEHRRHAVRLRPAATCASSTPRARRAS